MIAIAASKLSSANGAGNILRLSEFKAGQLAPLWKGRTTATTLLSVVSKGMSGVLRTVVTKVELLCLLALARAALTQPDGKVVAGGWVQIERGGGNGPGNTAMMLTRYR